MNNSVKVRVSLLPCGPQDPVMPSQEPSSDAKGDEVDVPPDDGEDTDGGETLKAFKWLTEFL